MSYMYDVRNEVVGKVFGVGGVLSGVGSGSGGSSGIGICGDGVGKVVRRRGRPRGSVSCSGGVGGGCGVSSRLDGVDVSDGVVNVKELSVGSVRRSVSDVIGRDVESCTRSSCGSGSGSGSGTWSRSVKSSNHVCSDGYFAGDFTGADGKLNHFRDIHWIYENLDMKGVTPGDAPSAGAYTWLMEIRGDESGESRRKFRDYYMKIAPSSKELESRMRLSDDGRNVLELIDSVERALGIFGK